MKDYNSNLKNCDYYMPEPDCWDCEDDGHDYKLLSCTEDGSAFYKCLECGEECEE